MNNVKKIQLPSNGLVGETPAEVTIRGMKGREISTLYSSLTEAAIEEIIKEVTNPSLNPDDLCDEDKSVILHETRRLTFGDEVEQSLRCPICGKIHKYVISYDDLNFVLLDEDKMAEVLTTKGGKRITRRVPTKKDWTAIHRHKEKRNLPDTYAFLLLQISKINTIDNKKPSILEMVEYLENLPGKELLEIVEFLDNNFGLDTTYKVECNFCHTDFTGGIGINADLFH